MRTPPVLMRGYAGFAGSGTPPGMTSAPVSAPEAAVNDTAALL